VKPTAGFAFDKVIYPSLSRLGVGTALCWNRICPS
jgi:hypothetical protein